MGFNKDYCIMKIKRYDKNGLIAQTTEPIIYTTKSGEMISAPAGFNTNFASVPRICYVLLTPMGKHTQASILHDYLYSRACVYDLSRKQADIIFYEAMRDSLVNPITAKLMYYAVRIFGKSFYKKD